MKKCLLAVIFICIVGTSLFAWDAKDLTKFPSCMDGKSWILNFGVGLPGSINRNHVNIPPVRLSFDRNVEIGDNKLPFFAGGIVVYSGEGFKGDNHTKEWFTHNISTGGRFGYHFNWNVKNLDTYAVTTAGYTFYSHTGHYKDYHGDYDRIGDFYWGVSIGARYFVSKGFGFWTEAGYNTFSWLDIGLAFKF